MDLNEFKKMTREYPEQTFIWEVTQNSEELDGLEHIVYRKGDKYWFRNGVLHRTDGPAIETSYKDDNEWWIDGEAISKRILKNIREGITIKDKDWPQGMDPNNCLGTSLLTLAVEVGNEENIKMLLELGAKSSKSLCYGGQGTYQDNVAIVVACEKNNLDLLKLLVSYEPLVDDISSSQCLFYAIKHENTEMINYLVENGVSISEEGDDEVIICWNFSNRMNHFKATKNVLVLQHLVSLKIKQLAQQ